MDFMGKRLVHTPEGVRDIYGAEYASKLQIENLLHDELRSFGYQDIQTPTFEFFDVFGREIGTPPSKELYKFFDKEGNTLVLRPDFTPSIARSAAKYFMDETIPLRFCYCGNNYINTSNLQGKLKETTQMGAELIGDASAQADAEMIALLIKSLLNVGLKEFQVSVGQVDYFKGLCNHASLDEDTELELREFISNRNGFSAEELLLNKDVSREDVDALLRVSELFGSYEVLDDAMENANNEQSRAAIERLRSIYEVLKLYGVERYVSFDLAMISKYHYYTGVIFNAYTYQSGSAIAKGGRYDNLLARFGKPSPATGFVVVIDDLMNAMTRQKICPSPSNRNLLLVYDCTLQKAIKAAEEYRAQGFSTVLMHQEKDAEMYEKFAKDNNFAQIKFLGE